MYSRRCKWRAGGQRSEPDKTTAQDLSLTRLHMEMECLPSFVIFHLFRVKCSHPPSLLTLGHGLTRFQREVCPLVAPHLQP